jgi:hypothetical protein
MAIVRFSLFSGKASPIEPQGSKKRAPLAITRGLSFGLLHSQKKYKSNPRATF